MAHETFQIVDLVARDTDQPGLWPEERQGRRWGQPGVTTMALLIFGRTLGGRSIMVTVRGMPATLHVRFPVGERDATHDLLELPRSLWRTRQTVIDALSDVAAGVVVTVERHTPMGQYGLGGTELFIAVRAQTSMFAHRARQAIERLGPRYEVVAPGRVFLRETALMADLQWEQSSLLTLGDLPPRCLGEDRSACHLEVLLERTDLPELLFPAANQLLSAPLVALSYDIESAAPGGGFPDAGRASDQIVCIGVQWGVVDRPDHDQSLVLCLDSAGVGWGTPPTGRFECFATERQLIERFACLAREVDPDLYTGYNLAGFDAQYVWRRGAMTGAEEALEQMGRLRRLPSELVQRTLQTSSGEVVCHDIRQLGRVTVDMYREIQTSCKLPSYTLQNVSEHLLGAGKHDIGDYTLIPVYASGADDTELGARASGDDRLAQVLRFMPPEAYARVVACVPAAHRADVLAHVSGKRYAGHRAAVAAPTPPDPDAGLRRRSELADYCRQDASLAMQLMRKVGTVPALLAMSRVTHTSMHNLLSRGQQTKVFSMLYTGARARGLVMTTPPEVYCNVQGATVLEPIRGVHTLPVATLDFASLYPNCFRAANICYSTFVSLRDAHDPEPAVPAADRTDLWIDDRTIVSFVKPAVRAGLLPIIAAELMAARKATRAAQRAHVAGSVEHRNLENRQLALKISVNAIYGGLGVVDGNYSLHPAAAATTAVGRRALAVTQRLCRDEMQDLAGRVIYGDTDSVMVELRVDPVLWSEPPRSSESDPRRLHGTDGVREAFRVGTALEERLNSRIAQEFGCEFLVLEFEQLFNVSCFLSPKRYMGSRWVGTPELSVGLYLKGVQSERRDSSAPQREALRGTMAALMFSESPDPIDRVEGAVHALQGALQRFLDHDVPMDDYIMTKSLRDHYRVPNAKGPHLTILKKMRARAPGSEPQPGNRVPYIIIYDGSCGTRASTVSERAEDPDYALDHGRVPDRCFYANLMLNAMSDMLDPLLPVGQHVRVIARPYLDRMAAQDAGVVSLSAMGPPALPLLRLAREMPTRSSSQTKLGFLPMGRSERTHRPPSRPTKRVRETSHPKLRFKALVDANSDVGDLLAPLNRDNRSHVFGINCAALAIQRNNVGV